MRWFHLTKFDKNRENLCQKERLNCTVVLASDTIQKVIGHKVATAISQNRWHLIEKVAFHHT